MTPVFLMSPPRRDWALRGRANFKSEIAGNVDASRARGEWAELADAIIDAGGEVAVMPPGDASLTGLIYTAEAGELYRGEGGEVRFLLPSMAVDHRLDEADHIASFIEERLGFRTDRVEAVWEAQGDAIRAGGPDEIVHTYGAGSQARTSKNAYTEVADRMGGRHIQIGFRADPWFHGNTFLQFFRTATDLVMLVCPDALLDGEYERLKQFVDNAAVVELTRQQSEGYDTNALQVGDTVIAPRSFSDIARGAVEEMGLRVEMLELGELFSKGGGAPVCLTNRLWRLRPDELPEEVRWSRHPEIESHTDM